MAQVAEGGAGHDHREHTGCRAVERQRDGGEGRGADRADAGGEAVDAVDEVEDVHQRDDPDHGEHVRERLAEVDRPDERQGEVLDAHA